MLICQRIRSSLNKKRHCLRPVSYTHLIVCEVICHFGPVHGIRVLLMYAYRNSILFGILHVGSPHFYSHRFLHSASEVDRIGIVEQSILTLCVFGSDYSGSCGQCLDKNTVNNCIGAYR